MEVMMVLPASGERALRVLEIDMPWLANRVLPHVAEDSLAVGITASGKVMAVVYDEANDAVRELPADRRLLADPLRMHHAAAKAVSAPWN